MYPNENITQSAVSSLRTTAVPEQRRDGHVLQKLPGQKQSTTCKLQQVSCFVSHDATGWVSK